jgi:NADP oxidoreductase coenzyme F420-dependent
MGGDITTIAVVGGTGAKGSAIALRLGHAGYRVIIGTRNSSRGARKCEELNGILGHSAVRFATNEEAARAAELVILTVPYNAQIVIAKELGPALEGKILIDATVPLVPPKISSALLPAGGRRSRRFSRCWATRCGWFRHSRMSPLTSCGDWASMSDAMSLSAAMSRRHAPQRSA